MINQIRSFISQCPCLSGRLVNINYLGSKTGCVSLENSSSEKPIKEYTDGERLCSARFVLSLRESFSQSVNTADSISAFFEEFSQWLRACTDRGNLPLLQGGITPLSILPDGSYTVKNTNNTTARYQITFELLYHKKENYYYVKNN